ncbi:hypothetical protein ACIA5C_28740 [Actinoplanes sp. NPDC051343]|uniref:hypothetical protein n=1 Tax=Actinoplanes sp. NPDC051343 TaxID=3363906 RepID=UPI00378AB850
MPTIPTTCPPTDPGRAVQTTGLPAAGSTAPADLISGRRRRPVGGPRDDPPSVVVALRDYAVGIGIPKLEVHLSGEGEPTGIDFRSPTAEAASLLVGALYGRPVRPPDVCGQAPSESPFTRFADLAREVQAAGDHRALVTRSRTAADDLAVRDLATPVSHRPDRDAACIRPPDATIPQNAKRIATGEARSDQAHRPRSG